MALANANQVDLQHRPATLGRKSAALTPDLRDDAYRIAERGSRTARRLLVATDLSPRSDLAVARAAFLAHRSGADLLLLHAVGDLPADQLAARRRDAAKVVGRRTDALAAVGLNLQVFVEAGGALDCLAHAAEVHEADLVVVGGCWWRHSHAAMLGRSAERSAQFDRCPVLIVNRTPDGPYHKILAAMDFDAGSVHALHSAAALGLLADADLAVVHAFRQADLSRTFLGNCALQGIEGRVAAHQIERALAGFLVGSGFDLGPRIRLVIEEGQPAVAIRREITDLGPDLVVAGTGGQRIGLEHFLLGNVAEKLTAGADHDVLVVPPGRLH